MWGCRSTQQQLAAIKYEGDGAGAQCVALQELAVIKNRLTVADALTSPFAHRLKEEECVSGARPGF